MRIRSAALAVLLTSSLFIATPASAALRVADDINVDIATATKATNAYWARNWTQFFRGTYQPPNVFGSFQRGKRNPPACGGSRTGFGNAFYCVPGDFIAWDFDLMASGYRSGDAWVYLVIAHEWGHAVQARIQRSLVHRAAELQADCFAGATLFGAAAQKTLLFEDGDVAELRNALARMGDRTPWTDVGDHGSAEQRIAFFNRGAEGGVRACLPTASQPSR
ncbi:neutral zinc metallopeptidase [Herbidospora sp. RD11066]